MNSVQTNSPNSVQAISERVHDLRIGWKWPLILVVTRLLLAVILQALLAWFFWLRGVAEPWETAAPWWIVYGTLIDLGCILFIVRQLRKEGLRLFDLFGYKRKRLGKDLLLGLGLTVPFFLLAVIGGMLSGGLIYGAPQAPVPMTLLPLWGTLYALIVWPLIWGIVEQLTYQGYALPRLEVLTGKRWVAVGIITLAWAAQHIAMPIMFDWRWGVYRFASSLLIGLGVTLMYVRLRRLLPLVIAHWLTDLASVITLVLLPMLAAS
jgi:uncharacterized protein